MSYVAIKGGAEAINSSKRFFHAENAALEKVENDTLIEGLRFSCDRIMGEGALYTEKLAAEAIKKTGGDLLEAAFYVRAHRSTCQRIGAIAPVDTENIRIVRRVSSAFKEIEGGQILGPSCDYVIRLFSDLATAKEKAGDGNKSVKSIRVKSALSALRQEDKVMFLENKEDKPFDITRSFPLPPYQRSALMQTMARGETGAMLAFSYTSMRGYGDVHPTIGDLRLGIAEIKYTHPFTSQEVKVGEMRVTACETVGAFERDERDGKLRLAVGYGFCFGFNETKAIAMSILDLAMHHRGYSVGGTGIADNPEMVIHHIDAIESMGFANHFKLPHYVTFQADLHVLKKAKEDEDDE